MWANDAGNALRVCIILGVYAAQKPRQNIRDSKQPLSSDRRIGCIRAFAEHDSAANSLLLTLLPSLSATVLTVNALKMPALFAYKEQRASPVLL